MVTVEAGDDLVVGVTDNGVGLPPDVARSGLLNLERRARECGGTIIVSPNQDGGTRLSYDVEANVGGKLAQLGGRLINGVAKKYADEFFANFAKILSPAETTA